MNLKNATDAAYIIVAACLIFGTGLAAGLLIDGQACIQECYRLDLQESNVTLWVNTNPEESGNVSYHVEETYTGNQTLTDE